MQNQVLSIEQMQELIELGIDTSKASMCWYSDNDVDYPDNPIYMITSSENIGINYPGRIPTFTLQDILNIIQTAKCLKPGHIMTLVFCEDKNYITPNIYDAGAHRAYGSTPLEAAFEMLKWCKQNHYC